MNTVILCNGNYAKTPYYLAEEDLHLYSVEELCFYLYKNAFLLGEDFFCDDLIAWIREELGLASWADTLLGYRDKEETLLSSIVFLFLSTGYYDREVCEKIKRLLQGGMRLSNEERRKMRADAYYKRRRFALAVSEYEALLTLCREDQVKFKAKLHHNIGVCYAGMFRYDQAAAAFKRAFEAYPNTESYVQMLAALKLDSSSAEYLSYLSEHPESYEDSLEVEARIKRAQEEWDKLTFKDVVDRTMEEKEVSYYGALEQLLSQAKQEYMLMADKG